MCVCVCVCVCVCARSNSESDPICHAFFFLHNGHYVATNAHLKLASSRWECPFVITAYGSEKKKPLRVTNKSPISSLLRFFRYGF